MNYSKISKETMDHLYAAYKSQHDFSSLSEDLRALLELRVSQMNGCVYCCNIHRNDALKLGVSEQKIEHLPAFPASDEFSHAEKEALHWAESLTTLAGNIKVQDTELSKYFTEKEIVDMTICISLMNTFNRLAISMRDA